LKNKREKQAEKSREKDETIILEAKEIVKFFKNTGEPAKKLTLEPVQPKRCSLFVSPEEYEALFKETFRKLELEDQFSGFKFSGKDFSKIEFTQYHDVYYNNGIRAEQIDKDYARLRDRCVGITRETFTTLDAKKAPQKLKLRQQPSVQTREKENAAATRRSPRKKNKDPKRVGADIGQAVPINVMKSGKRRRSDDNSTLAAVKQKSLPSDNQRKTSNRLNESQEEIRKKKLRVAVYSALRERGVEESHALFRRCFSTLFKMCQIISASKSGGTTSQLLLDVARSNVDNVIKTSKGRRS